MKMQFGSLLAVFFACSAFSDDLPEWYTANRIQFHWEDCAKDVERRGGVEKWSQWLKSIHRIIADSGTKVVVASGRYGAEGAWWPTAVGENLPEFGTNDILRECVIDDYHRHGIRTIVYYRHDMDYAMQELHPEWLARNADGSPVSRERAVKIFGKTPYQMCQNSPFREFTKQRLIEIFERGAEGVYFDEVHMPEVCFCGNCKQAFEKKYGHPMPKDPQPGTAEYLEVSRFVGQTLADAFTEWKEAVHKVSPQGVLLVSSPMYGRFVGLHHTEEMAMAGSANKSEFQKCFGGQQNSPNTGVRKLTAENSGYWMPPRDLAESLDWMINRDVQGGNPPDIWVHRPDPETEGEVLHTAAAVVAHGAVAGMSVPVAAPHVPVYQKLFAMNDALAPFMKDARPYAWAVIHVSNELKEKLYVEGGADPDAQYKILFEGLYAPVLGAANTLRRAHIPFATVSDTLLRQKQFAPETRVLIIPDYQRLSDSIRSQIDTIEKAGTVSVIKLSTGKSTHGWHRKDDQKLLGGELLTDIQKVAGKPPVSIEGPQNLVSTVMINKRNGHLMVSLVRNWDWFWFWNKQPGQIWKEERPKQPPIGNVKIMSESKWSSSDLWPEKLQRSVATSEISIPGVDIARFVELSPANARQVNHGQGAEQKQEEKK
jgi:hypothetical protein